ncbi:MAG: PEP-CTERM sorting domain-containing protein [Kiritimatiellae bacterium]|nr:PEP-CTERM sorting domain-containing protein [Kiritimatiellia bacterium]
MKKLLTLAAVTILAATTHAAAVGWTIGGATAYTGGNYDLFVIGLNGVTGVDQITTLVAAGTDVSTYAFAEGSIATAAISATVANSGKSITYSGSGTDTYQAFAVLWKADGSEASYTSTASISLANDLTGKTFAFTNQSSNLAANNFTVAAPEPTSGLLVLLGVAGLALRRRRA